MPRLDSEDRLEKMRRRTSFDLTLDLTDRDSIREAGSVTAYREQVGLDDRVAGAVALDLIRRRVADLKKQVETDGAAGITREEFEERVCAWIDPAAVAEETGAVKQREDFRRMMEELRSPEQLSDFAKFFYDNRTDTKILGRLEEYSMSGKSA